MSYEQAGSSIPFDPEVHASPEVLVQFYAEASAVVRARGRDVSAEYIDRHEDRRRTALLVVTYLRNPDFLPMVMEEGDDKELDELNAFLQVGDIVTAEHLLDIYDPILEDVARPKAWEFTRGGLSLEPAEKELVTLSAIGAVTMRYLDLSACTSEAHAGELRVAYTFADKTVEAATEYSLTFVESKEPNAWDGSVLHAHRRVADKTEGLRFLAALGRAQSGSSRIRKVEIDQLRCLLL